MDYEITLGTSVRCKLCKKYIYKGFKGFRNKRSTFCSLEHFVEANPKLINPSPKKFETPLKPSTAVLENQVSYKKSVQIGTTWKEVWKLKPSDLQGRTCVYCQSLLGKHVYYPVLNLHFCDYRCAFNRQVDRMPLEYAVNNLLKIKDAI